MKTVFEGLILSASAATGRRHALHFGISILLFFLLVVPSNANAHHDMDMGTMGNFANMPPTCSPRTVTTTVSGTFTFAPSLIAYLRSSGAAFCTSFNSYSAPVFTTTGTEVPPAATATTRTMYTTSTTLTMSITATTTVTVTTRATVTATATMTTADTEVTDTVSVEIVTETYTAVATAANAQRKRSIDARALPTVTRTVLPGAYEIVVQTVSVDVPGGAKVSVPSGAAGEGIDVDKSIGVPSEVEAHLDLHRRAEPTPSVVASWHPAMISAACSSVATGNRTVTATNTRPAPTTVVTSTATITATGVAYATVELVTATEVATATVTATSTHTVTTTSMVTFTSVSSSTTTTTITRTVEPLVLESPAGIFGNPQQGLARDGDDNYYNLTLPFEIGAYGVTSATIFLSTNGMISHEATYEWVNQPLPASGQPSEQYPKRAVPSVAIFGFWTDLYMRSGYPHGIYYEIAGDIGSRSITFEYYATRYNDEEGYYHFTMAFYEHMPGVIDLRYYEMGNNASVGTAGVQHRDAGKWLQFSYNEPKLYRGVAVRLDTRGPGNGTITESIFP